MITEVVSEKGRFIGPSGDHPSVGDTCPGCGEPLEAGDVPALVNPEPPTEEDEGKQFYNAVVHVAHERCAYPEGDDDVNEETG